MTALLREIAYHEAGHSVIARALALPAGKATLRDHDGVARAYFNNDGSNGYILAVLAGRAATQVIIGYATASGCTFDDARAANLLMAGGRDLASARIAFHQHLADAKGLIRFHRRAVERVARALLERETLSGREIDKLMTA
jgi:ATP-dependent Zn protease